MAEDQDRKAPDHPPQQPVPPNQTPPPQTSERDVPLDTRLLSDAVIELNISRKNVGIYPPGHIQITKSIDRAFEVLLKLFEIRQEMTLGVAKDTLFVGQNYLDQRNPVYKDFALSMNQQGIAAVTFVRGLDREELVRFHRIITAKPDEITSLGGIAKVVERAGIPHIRVMAIDYASFHLTEEKEIFKSPGNPGEKPGDKPGGGVWQDFVSLLSTGTLATAGEGVSLKDSSQIDPAELAKLLNERKLDSGSAVQSYDRIISSYVRTSAEKKQLTQEQSQTIANLNKLMKDLHPDIRKQFLSTAFKNVSDNAASPGAEEVLGGLGDDMIIDMLRQASMEGREISPTLTGLLGKLASVRDKAGQTQPGGSAASGKVPSGSGMSVPNAASRAAGSVVGAVGGTGTGTNATGKEGAAPEILPEHMAKLFDREKYEGYVEKEYDDILKSVSERAESMAVTAKDRFPVDEYIKELDDQHLDFQIGRAVLAFMEENIDEEDYREFSKKLVAIVPDMLASGHFPLLLDMLQTLRWHLSDKKSEGVRACAAEALQVFWAPAFIDKSIEAFNTWSRTRGKDASSFMLALGPILVPGLLEIYSYDTAPGGRRVLFELLCTFGKDAVAEAVKRLGDPRAYYVRNLLMLIRRAGTPDVIASVKPLLQHTDPKVRLDALAVLLRFKDPAAVGILRQEINSRDPDVSSAAVLLAGQFRIADVVMDILPLIKRTILFETDYGVNEEIIRVLGEIGDSRAIPDLEKLAKAGWSLYRKSHALMKVTLYASLGRYPKESIAELIRIGERSGDDKIRMLCRKYAERK
jgi:HEAT repeat protein